MEKIDTRLSWIEQQVVRIHEDELEERQRAAYTRITAALRAALPDDEYEFALAENCWSRRVVARSDHRNHHDKLAELNGRIQSGSLSNDDRLMLASLSRDDLALIGSTAEDVVATACAILSAY